uniref:Nonsense-mediated mRNA decay factor SMG8 n=1 Tax=Romanomermis culicivorax TaxID=13658 RepID=A0A915K0W3_ROMCU
MQSIQILKQQARGPCLEKSVEKLAQECEAYWENGRKACEVYSLTGNVCLNQLHRVSGKEFGLEHLPLMWHTSKVRYLSTCNCGRRQAWRDDPFEIYEANYAFYELNKDFSCCDRLEKLEAPVYVRKRKIKTKSMNEEEQSKENIRKDFPAPRLRKISVEQLFENLRLGMAATQEETKSRFIKHAILEVDMLYKTFFYR